MNNKKLCKDCDLIEWKQNGGILRPFSTAQIYKKYKKNGEPELMAICPKTANWVKPNHVCSLKD